MINERKKKCVVSTGLYHGMLILILYIISVIYKLIIVFHEGSKHPSVVI